MTTQTNSKAVIFPNQKDCLSSLSPASLLSSRQSQRWFRNRLALLAMAAITEFGLIAPLYSQVFTTVHTFNGEDGYQPQDLRLVLSGARLYGLTSRGGTYGRGNLFTCNTDGTGFRTLYSFSGDEPVGTMVLSDDMIYGVACDTGWPVPGSIFAVKTDGTGFNVLHSFSPGTNEPFSLNITNSDGAMPTSGLVLVTNTLYGTTLTGGSSGVGTVFALNTDGTGFRVLHIFTGGGADGASPRRLILSGNSLYGTTQAGGSSDLGTVFAINTDGSGFKLLHSLNRAEGGGYGTIDVVLSGNTLYGASGGLQGSVTTVPGTLFALNVDGTGFVILHTFDPFSGIWPIINADGVGPGGLALSGNTIYGTTIFGGPLGVGTVFKANTDGTGFTTIYNFTTPSTSGGTNSEGYVPGNPLALSGGTLYGMASRGGNSGYGTLFSITLPNQPQPHMSLTPSGGNLIVSWPSNATGLTLQSTTNLASPIWTTNLPPPSVVNGQNKVIIPMSGTQQFFRLSQ